MGVPGHLHERLRAGVEALTERGFEVHVRPHVLTVGLTPASAAARAEDLHAAFAAADVVLPPWGGELAIELLERIDWDALAGARPWFVGWSDISTLLLPLTTRTGLATLHGANLMDEPYELPTEFTRWTDVVTRPPGAPSRNTAPLAGAVGRSARGPTSRWAANTPTTYPPGGGPSTERTTSRCVVG